LNWYLCVWQYIQKKDAAYEFFKDDTVWSMDKLNTYINRRVAPSMGLELDWVHKTLKVRPSNCV